ncbi:hypothetical protein C8Q77DRAFT_670457 [Trametes polyzona]|nr:hypothetical protein C8Q77DRAFT_670457 [Trametes polyzona]
MVPERYHCRTLARSSQLAGPQCPWSSSRNTPQTAQSSTSMTVPMPFGMPTIFSALSHWLVGWLPRGASFLARLALAFHRRVYFRRPMDPGHASLPDPSAAYDSKRTCHGTGEFRCDAFVRRKYAHLQVTLLHYSPRPAGSRYRLIQYMPERWPPQAAAFTRSHLCACAVRTEGGAVVKFAVSERERVPKTPRERRGVSRLEINRQPEAAEAAAGAAAARCVRRYVRTWAPRRT